MAQSSFINKELEKLMLNFLIFSKDRACQLDALLRSIYQFCNTLNNHYKISILYTYSDSHKASYELCKHKHPKPKWIKETNFEEQTKSLLENKKICLLTDDTLFFRKFSYAGKLENNEVFSWRLGHNTYIQDHIRGIEQPRLRPQGECTKLIWWNPNVYPANCNYGYPFSFDGHVYPENLLFDLLKDSSFKSTNDMEGILHSKRFCITKLYSNFHSSCVNIPVNNISGLTASGAHFSYSLDELKDMFVSGKRIKLFDQNGHDPILGCHQEFKFEFYGQI